MMDREHLCESLVLWLQTFNVGGPQSSVEDLTDGITMAQALHQIAPAFFNDAWTSKIKTDASANWRLKVSNLKKILKGILDYNTEVLGQNIQDFHMPDINAIGEHHNAVELGRLLQLILGCAVNCDAKQEYIQRIMALEESVQHVVMTAIQELMTKEMSSSGAGDGYTELNEQLKRMSEDLHNSIEQREELAQRCHELDLQVANLQEERMGIVQDNERLNERINMAENLEDPSTPAGRRYQQLQGQLEHFQEELFRMEASRDDFRIKADLQEKEIIELQQKNEDQHALAQEASLLKDEVDILRAAAEKVPKYEASIENFKKKLEELGDLKAQLKMLEEKNTAYMQTNMELEEEIKKSSSMRSQLDLYKRQSQEIQLKAQDETKRADKAEFEAKRAHEKLTSALREKERLVEERDSLKDINEELRCSQLQRGSGPFDEDGNSNLEMMAMPPEIKEKFLRLQHENKMLKLEKNSSSDEQTAVLQSLLDDTTSRQNELQSDNRIMNQRILELEAQIEDLQESQEKSASARSEGNSDLRKKLSEHVQRTQNAELAESRMKVKLEEMEMKVKEALEVKAKLEDQLKKKEDDMQLMEDKYMKYLEKAKSVIKSMSPRNNVTGASSMEVHTLKTQLHEKEKLLKDLHREQDKAKSIRDNEDKLMTTAFHKLGLQLQQRACEDRLSNNTNKGQSFLARQRQAHTRRPHNMLSSPLSASGSR